MDEALKPCPAECLHTVDRGGPSLFRRRGDIFGVYCQTCQCSTEYYSTEAEAITAWNTRADAAPTPKADEVKAVARAVHGELSHIDVMKYLDMPDNTADRVAQAAIAALDAARGDPVARVVEWLRKENGLCDCHARCETECGCGAWDDWKTKPLLEIADAIEQSFANKT